MDIEWFKKRKKAVKTTDAAIAKAVGRDRTVVTKVLGDKSGFELIYLDGLASCLEAPKIEILRRAGILSDGDLADFRLSGATVPPPNLPSADDFAEILRALAPLALASLDSEDELQELGAHFREAVADRMTEPERSIDRAIGALEQRLKDRGDDPASRPT